LEQRDKDFFDRIDEAANKLGLTFYEDKKKTVPKPLLYFLGEVAKKWNNL